jgi:hypothetical protein
VRIVTALALAVSERRMDGFILKAGFALCVAAVTEFDPRFQKKFLLRGVGIMTSQAAAPRGDCGKLRGEFFAFLLMAVVTKVVANTNQKFAAVRGVGIVTKLTVPFLEGEVFDWSRLESLPVMAGVTESRPLQLEPEGGVALGQIMAIAAGGTCHRLMDDALEQFRCRR